MKVWSNSGMVTIDSRTCDRSIFRLLVVMVLCGLVYGWSAWPAVADSSGDGGVGGSDATRYSPEEGSFNSPHSSESSATKRVVRRETRVLADPRGAPELTVCSQNLKLFGSFEENRRRNQFYSSESHRIKIDALVQRFLATRCDVIAVQEVMGANADKAKKALEQLATALRTKSNRIFSVHVAPPIEGEMTSGFLVAADRASVQQVFPYARVELPKINDKARPRLFSRTPFEIQLLVAPRGSGESKVVSLVNFHFKSKRGGRDDPSGLEWETYRMEMAEALRRIVELRHQKSFGSGESLLVLLGDRNCNFDVASARILEGRLDLTSFRNDGPCRLSKRGVPLCRKENHNPQKLFSVLTTDQSLARQPGTFSYKGTYSWLDDILVPHETLPTAWKTATSEGDYESGVVYTPAEASDHALVYVRFNW